METPVSSIEVCLEAGERRVFASALDWPGWCRSGRDEASALAELAAYAPRYRKAITEAPGELRGRVEPSSFEVVERLHGNATTDFGAPGVMAKADHRPLDPREAHRLARLLRGAWTAFDRSAAAAEGVELRKGPRGGGRELQAIVEHVLDADIAYLAKLGGPAYRKPGGADPAEEAATVRATYLDVVRTVAAGEPPPRQPRSGKLWPPRYAVRRSAWHALDHAWEIEDRAGSD